MATISDRYKHDGGSIEVMGPPCSFFRVGESFSVLGVCQMPLKVHHNLTLSSHIFKGKYNAV